MVHAVEHPNVTVVVQAKEMPEKDLAEVLEEPAVDEEANKYF